LSRLAGLLRELGPGTAALYALARGLERLGGWAAVHDLLLYTQPVHESPLLPPGRGAGIEVREMDGATALGAGLPCPLQLAAGRRHANVRCLAAYQDGRLIGFHWLNLGPHADEMVRARYLPQPEGHAAWSFHLQVEPAHRGGLAFPRLTDATWALLRRHGRTALASYIAASNRAAIAAEERLGGRRVGRAVHVRLGPLQLMLANLPPYLHLSVSDRHPPALRIGETA